MYKSIYLFLLLIIGFFSGALYAYEDELALKGGVGVGHSSFRGAQSSKDRFVGYGVNTQFGYRWKVWELNLASYIFFGKVDDITFKTSTLEIHGSGSYRSFNFAPMIKYLTPYSPISTWKLYVSAGPTWSFKTFNLNQFSTRSQTDPNQTFDDNNKITYLSNGASVAVGLEEIDIWKDSGPMFLELLFNYNYSQKIFIVDASDTKRVETVSKENTRPKTKDTTWILSVGITIF